MAKKPKDPAHDGADARTGDDKTENSPVVLPRNTALTTLQGAHARHPARLIIEKNADIESTSIDNNRYFKDTDLGKILGFSRPRDIRKPLLRMIESGDITDDQHIVVDDDDGGQVYYLDNLAAMKLTVRTKSVTEEMIMKMIATVSAPPTMPALPIAAEKALAGYQRSIVYLSRKDVPPAAKRAMVPILERYARAADVAMPDVSELIGPETPRLPGV